jgi:hypothetical protein
MLQRLTSVMPPLARIGLPHLVPSFGTLPAQARKAARAFGSSPRELRADRADLVQLPRMFDRAKALKTLGGKPRSRS